MKKAVRPSFICLENFKLRGGPTVKTSAVSWNCISITAGQLRSIQASLPGHQKKMSLIASALAGEIVRCTAVSYCVRWKRNDLVMD